MGKINSQALNKFSHTKKSSRKFGRNFRKGPGGQISFKMSQEPKTIKKKHYQEVGHGTQEYDLTTMFILLLQLPDTQLRLLDNNRTLMYVFTYIASCTISLDILASRLPDNENLKLEKTYILLSPCFCFMYFYNYVN